VIPAVTAFRLRADRSEEQLLSDVALVVGVSLLLFRPFGLGAPGAVALFGMAYLLLGAISVAAPAPRVLPAFLDPLPVLVVGAGAVALAWGTAGPRIPTPTGQSALVLGALAAVAEEAFFRRFLYGRLVRYGALAAVFTSALLFALVHLPAYGLAAFWVDLGAGLLLSWQRWASGSWAVPAATHVLANVLAVM